MLSAAVTQSVLCTIEHSLLRTRHCLTSALTWRLLRMLLALRTATAADTGE
jgi:hypothetical protein